MSEKNLRGLRRLHDDVEAHVRSLKALGIEPDSYGAMLAPVLLNKLPPDIRLIVSHKIAASDPGACGGGIDCQGACGPQYDSASSSTR